MASQLCRLCTKSAESAEALPNIFTHSHKELLQRVKELTGILIKNMRNVPQRICPQCVLDLEQAYSFRKRCIKAQTYYNSAAYRHLLRAEPDKRMQLKTKRQTRADKQQATDVVEVAPKAEPVEQGEKEERCVSESEMELNTEIVLLKCEPELSDLSNSQESLAIALDDEEFLPLLERPLKDEQQSPADEFPAHKTAAPARAAKRTLSVKRHKKRSGDERQTEFICDQCGNHFKVYSHFQMHLKRHTGEKTHQCEVCPDKFFTHSELTRHMRRHTGERPFACRHCQRRFTDYSTRVKHERTHTNERPFLCTHCGKAFTTSYILKNHMLVHTGERSFKCHSCNKSFQRQTHLIVHYRSIMHKQNEEKQQRLPDSLPESVTSHWQSKG